MAAVCRDDQDNYMGSSALVVLGLKDLATLEAIACREGMVLAEICSFKILSWHATLSRCA